MKNPFIILSLLLLGLNGFGQNIKSPEELGKLVFESLKTKNITLFKNGETKLEDLKYIISKDTEQRRIKVEDERFIKLDSIFNKYIDDILLSFNKTIEKGEKDGLIWSDIIYLKTNYYKRSGGPEDYMEIGKIYIELQYKELIYIIKVGDSMKIKGTWSIEDKIHWKGKKEEN